MAENEPKLLAGLKEGKKDKKEGRRKEDLKFHLVSESAETHGHTLSVYFQ